MRVKAQEKLSEEGLNDYFTWVKAVWVNSRGEPLDFEDHKYLVDLYKDQHPSKVIQKPAQCGISEHLISEAVWICDRLGKNVLFVFPTFTTLQDFVQARLNPVIEYSGYLSKITGNLSSSEREELDLGVGDKVSKIGLKRIRDGFLYLRGSQNERQIITVDADAVFLDERDRFIQEHVPYIDKRLLHSDLKWRREASTPTAPGVGINEAYNESDQRVWMLTCKRCGLKQELSFFDNVDFEAKITVCKRCRTPIDRLGDGEWVPQNPSSDIHGYRVNGLCNPKYTVAELVDTYYKAKVKGHSAMEQFYNQVLGLPYEVKGTAVLRSELKSCLGDYEMLSQGEFCYGGCDVGRELHVIISRKEEGKNRYIWIGTVKDFFGPVNSLEALIKSFKIKVFVVDAFPEKRKVKELIEAYPGKVYAAYYPSRKFSVQEYYKFDDFKNEVHIDRTIAMDYLVHDIQNNLIELPKNAQFVPDFFEQLVSPIRVTVTNPRTGMSEPFWEKRGADHYFHAAVYNRIATLKQVGGEALLETYRKQDEENGKFELPTNILSLERWVRLHGKRIF